jgi:hypothetical protein
MAAEPKGSPGWPELAFCTMSTAKKRSVLTHNSSNAGRATVERVASVMIPSSIPLWRDL